MAWYKNVAKAVSKAGGDIVSEAKRAPVIGKVVTPIVNTINKAGGDISAEAKRVGGNISAEGKRIGGQISGAFKEATGNGPSSSSIGGAPPEYGTKLNLTSSEGTSQVLSPNQISSQYANMSSLAKMREQGARQGEQTAISRRLAASGMGSSGAGMRMQQQAADASARRSAEQQLGIGAEEAQAKQRMSESEANRGFQERQFEYQKQKDLAEFEVNKQVIAENQRIAREVQRYNDKGLFEQLGQDLFGKGTTSMFSIKKPFG